MMSVPINMLKLTVHQGEKYVMTLLLIFPLCHLCMQSLGNILNKTTHNETRQSIVSPLALLKQEKITCKCNLFNTIRNGSIDNTVHLTESIYIIFIMHRIDHIFKNIERNRIVYNMHKYLNDKFLYIHEYAKKFVNIAKSKLEISLLKTEAFIKIYTAIFVIHVTKRTSMVLTIVYQFLRTANRVSMCKKWNFLHPSLCKIFDSSSMWFYVSGSPHDLYPHLPIKFVLTERVLPCNPNSRPMKLLVRSMVKVHGNRMLTILHHLSTRFTVKIIKNWTFDIVGNLTSDQKTYDFMDEAQVTRLYPFLPDLTDKKHVLSDQKFKNAENVSVMIKTYRYLYTDLYL